MGDEYQNRRDIDKIYDDLYSQINGSLNVLKFKENSPYRNISSKEGDTGTIDAIIDYYGLTERGSGGGGDLSNYYTKEEIDGILSSYVTSDFANTHYAPLVHTHSVSDITGLSDVAVSGEYSDLDNIPSTFPPSTHSHNWDSVTGKPSTFPPSSHNHDDRYYTESEVDSALSNKADSTDVPTKTSDLTNDGSDGVNVFVSDDDSRLSDARTPTAHNHDDRYYTETETDTLLSGKASSSHVHNGTDLILDSTYIWNLDIGVGIPNAQNFLNAIDYAIGTKADSVHTHDDRYYTESEVDTALNSKQDNLVSGTNIRTVNGNTLLGSGDIVIGATGTIDDTVTQNSSNPVKSSGIYSALSNKANSTHSHSISDVTNLQSTLTNKVNEDDLLDLIYPIGSIYISASNTHQVCPIQLILGGTWERIQDKFLLASTDQQGVGTTGGSADAVVVAHTHTQEQHRHGLGSDWSSGSGSQTAYTYSANRGRTTKYSDYQAPTINSSGEDGTGKNMPPYIRVNVWKRVPDPE